jgi:ABC-type lipoprotein release transport system permease subunit
MGAGLGLLLACAVSQSLVAFLVTADDPVALHLGIDWRVLSFSMAIGLCTCLLFGLAPALWASRVQANPALAGGRRESASRCAPPEVR